MAVQELTQPILNPIAAFDATVEHTISFVAIGGAQVLGNRLVISNNQTGAVVYNQMQTTMRLEHVIPANTLQNGGYYNAVVYTVSSGGEESVASTAVPFYCYSRPTLTINNIPATETIENGTYTFTASYSQAENELLDSYQFTLYDSNRNILSQSNLIYYQTDSSLSYTFVGMSNDTAYYIGITGETVNGTQITSGLVYFTVRYSQPASFAICDLVNDCENGYIQISSNIVAIDGKSNPDPPIYIDDKEVDLREPGSWVEWDEGFDIQNDFTMRVWGRDFNEYENIITLMNDENTDSNPNRVELKWMVGDVLKNLPEYSSVNGYNINIENAEATTIENLRIAGNSIQQTNSGEQIVAGNGFVNFNTVAEKPINIEIEGTQEQETRSGKNKLNLANIQQATKNGITCTYNEDGSVTFNGTCTADNTSFAINNTNINAIKNQTTMSAFYEKGSISANEGKTAYIYARINTSDYSKMLSFIIADLNNSNPVISEQYKSDDALLNQFSFRIESGTILNSFTVKIMITDTPEEATEYEQYGATPSPEYPSPVVCVGSNKNYFGFNNPNEQSVNGITINNNGDGGIKVQGIATSNVNISTTSIIHSVLNGEYSFSIKAIGITNNIEVILRDENYLNIVAINNIKSSANNYKNFTASNKQLYQFNIYITEGTEVNCVLYPKVEEGTEATSYSPYNQGSVLISKVNKNFYDKDNIQFYNNNSSLFENTSNNNNARLRTNSFVLKEGSYIISGIPDNVNLLDVRAYNSEKEYIEDGVTLSKKNFTLKQGIEYIHLLFNHPNNSNISANEFSNANVMIEKGSTATEYVEHQQTDYLLYIQQEMLQGDYFVKEADGWKEVHSYSKKIFNGTEAWNLESLSQGNNFYTNISDALGDTTAPVYSNCFMYYNGFLSKNYSCRISGSKNLNLRCSEKNTAEEFKQMLADKYNAGNPVYIFYKLATPTRITCTSEQNTILNELSNNMSFVGENNIYTSGDLPIPIKVSDIATPTPYNPSEIYSLGDIRNLIDVADFNIAYNQKYFQATNTNFILKSNFIYTLSFNYEVNSTTTDLYYTLGYGTDNYVGDITGTNQYTSLTSGRNSITFVVPDDIPANSNLWVKFGQTIILADIDVNISDIQLEEGSVLHDYEEPELYNIYPTISAKNIYDENSVIYLKKENITYSVIQNGYNIVPNTVGETAYFGIGWRNILNPGDTYAIGYSSLGNLTGFNLYMVDKNTQNVIDEIELNNGVFVAPDGVYDLQLTFGVDSSVETNYVEIWNIQIEANNTVSQFETFISNGSVISTDSPLNGIGNYRDLIALESPNLLNQATQSGNVVGGETYYLNQLGDTTYYIWYYNIAGNLITFLDPEGQEAQGVSGVSGSFTVHEDCVKITMTKSANAEANDLTSDEILSNEVSITKGSTAQPYYPYITQPSKIVNLNRLVVNGTENWRMGSGSVRRFEITVTGNTPKIISGSTTGAGTGICNYFNVMNTTGDLDIGIYITVYPPNWFLSITDKNSYWSDVSELKDWLSTINSNGNPLIIDYVAAKPAIYPLPEESITALSELSTYNPISNVYTNNQVLGNISLDYVTGYSEQQTQNAYVQLKCYNSNNMPYFVHSNYIDIPEDISTVFIWCRRRNNLFDLQIEDLGDYDGGEQPEDTNPPVVTLDIDLEEVTSSTIPVTAQSIDDVGLRTVRFSKDNGQTWDEVVPVDGLSSTNSYTFTGLSANTLYTIRVEAIDLSGNIGGMSQQVTTHVS